MPQERITDEPDDYDVDPLFFSPRSVCYTPERDGSLEHYLQKHDGTTTTSMFYGVEHFNLLREQEWFLPGMSSIRLMWNTGRDDEYFIVDENYHLVGQSHLDAHAGREGVFRPEDLLTADAPPFEAHQLRGPAWRRMMDRLMDEERKRYEAALGDSDSSEQTEL